MAQLSRRTALIGGILSASIVLSACGGESKEQALADKRQSETTHVVDTSVGTIPLGFKVAPSFQSKAYAKIENITGVSDYSATHGLLATGTDKKKLYRIRNGQVAWSSEDQAGEYLSARFVVDQGRSWIVALYRVKNRVIVNVFDADSSSQNQEVLRKTDLGTVGAVITVNGILVTDAHGKTRQFLPGTGFSSGIQLPAGSKLVAPGVGGVFILKDSKVSLASTTGSGGWNSVSHLPEGMSKKAVNRMVGYASSFVALQWTEGSKNVLAIHSAATGELLAQGALDKGFPAGSPATLALRASASQAYVYSQNYVADLNSHKIMFYDKQVRGVADGIAYFDDGSGVDVATDSDVWEGDEDIEPVSSIFLRSGVFLKDDTLYLVNLKRENTTPKRVVPKAEQSDGGGASDAGGASDNGR